MNNDQVSGAVKNAAERLRSKMRVGSEKMQVKGAAKQVGSKIQNGAGDAREQMRRADKR